MAECYFNRALCYLQTEQTDKARADLEAVVKESADEALVESAQALLGQIIVN